MINSKHSTKLATLLVLASLAGCNPPPAELDLGHPEPLSVSSGPASEGPRISRGSQGRITLSWMERLPGGGGTLRFSAFSGDQWLEPEDVVSDPDMFVNWADVPSVLPLDSDASIAHWLSKSAASTYAYDIQMSHTTDGGKSWSDPTSPHKDGTPTEHGFVSIAHDQGATQLVWLDGRKTGRESTGRAVDTGMTLRAANVDAAGQATGSVLLDDLVCDCCRTDVVITELGPVAVYRNRTQDEIRDIYIARKIAGEWQKGEPLSHDNWEIAGCPVNGPAIATTGGSVAVAWFTAAGDEPKAWLRLSTDAGQSFGESILVSDELVMGQVDVEFLDDNNVAVSWLAENAEGTGDVRVAIVGNNGKKDSAVVGTTTYARAVPQMVLVEDALLFVWTDESETGIRLSSARVPLE